MPGRQSLDDATRRLFHRVLNTGNGGRQKMYFWLFVFHEFHLLSYSDRSQLRKPFSVFPFLFLFAGLVRNWRHAT